MPLLANDESENLNEQNEDEYSQLHLKAISGDLYEVKILVRGGANIDLVSQDELGCAALHYAVMHGHVAVVRYLIAHHANVNATDKFLWTPLHYAVANGYVRIVRLLLNANANPTARAANGMRPWHIARSEEQDEIEQLIFEATLRRDANVNVPNVQQNQNLEIEVTVEMEEDDDTNNQLLINDILKQSLLFSSGI